MNYLLVLALCAGVLRPSIVPASKAVLPAESIAVTSQCVVQNSTAYPLGLCAVSYGAGTCTFSIDGPGSYSVNVPSAPISITIQGQTVLYPNAGNVVLLNGKSVVVQWNSNFFIDIIDPNDEG